MGNQVGLNIYYLSLEQGRAWVRKMSGDGGRTSLIVVPVENLCETKLFDYELTSRKTTTP